MEKKKIFSIALLLAITVVTTTLCVTSANICTISFWQNILYSVPVIIAILCFLTYRYKLPTAIPLLASGILSGIPITIWSEVYQINSNLTLYSQIWSLVALIVFGVLYTTESKLSTTSRRYFIGIYWMLLFAIGVIIVVYTTAVTIISFGSAPEIYQAVFQLGVLAIIACLPNACAEFYYHFMLTSNELKRSWLLFGGVIAIVLFIIIGGKYFHLI